MIIMNDPYGLSDQDLIKQMDELARFERGALHDFLACLSEIERRGLHLDLGHHTLFDYCVARLRLSEGAAMQRIYAARAAAKHLDIYTYLRDGELNVGVVALLAPHLNPSNASSLLSEARGKSKWEIEALVVGLAHSRDEANRAPLEAHDIPQDELGFGSESSEEAAASSAAELPTVAGGPPAAAAEPPAVMAASQDATAEPSRFIPAHLLRRDSIRLESPGVLRVSFQATTAFGEKLERVRGLLCRRNGRVASILDVALEEYLVRHDPTRKRVSARKAVSRGRTRRILRWVKDLVWRRDEGWCMFTAPDGVRCSARNRLEYDHIRPWALGGASDDPANIRLLCRAHNLRAARKVFGDRVPAARPA